MRILVSFALLAVAAILVYHGIEVSDSIAATVERAVDGTPSDRGTWWFVGGAICGVIGLLGIVTRSPRAVG